MALNMLWFTSFTVLNFSKQVNIMITNTKQKEKTFVLPIIFEGDSKNAFFHFSKRRKEKCIYPTKHHQVAVFSFYSNQWN